MKEYRQDSQQQSFNLQTFLQFIRAAGALLGLIAIGFGVIYAVRLFSAIFKALQDP